MTKIFVNNNILLQLKDQNYLPINRMQFQNIEYSKICPLVDEKKVINAF